MSLNDFYHILQEKIGDTYNLSNHPFQKWLIYTHTSMQQKLPVLLKSPQFLLVTMSVQQCWMGEIPIWWLLYCVFFFPARDQITLLLHLFLFRYKRTLVNWTFFFSYGGSVQRTAKVKMKQKCITATFCMTDEQHWFPYSAFHKDHLYRDGVAWNRKV